MTGVSPPARLRGGAVRDAVRTLLLVSLGAAMLLWTAAANGRPAVFTDTALYYTEAEYLFEALGWVAPAQVVEPSGDPTALPATPGAPSVSASIDGARSAAYGAPLYLLQRLGSLWLVAAAQAFAATGAVCLLHRVAAPGRRGWAYLVLMGAVAAFTPLPFFVSWAMPDVFAGIAGCGLLLTLVYPDRLRPAVWVGVLLLTAAAMATHRSILVTGLAATGPALLILRLSGVGWRPLGRRALGVLAAGAVALALPALLRAPLEARVGEPIGSPPFLSARVLADGPGLAYLRQVCSHDADAYELCRFASRPMRTSDQVLWSIRRRTAVFLADTPAGRRRMEREDTRFAVGAFLSAPVAETEAALANALRQLAEIAVVEPLRPQSFYVRDGYWRRTALPRILPDAKGCAYACPPRVGEGAAAWLEGLGLGFSTLLFAWRLSRPDVRRLLAGRGGSEDLARLLAALAIAATLILLNAGVCGALSGPFPRYQARLVWLAPLMAGLLVAAGGWRDERTRPTVETDT